MSCNASNLALCGVSNINAVTPPLPFATYLNQVSTGDMQTQNNLGFCYALGIGTTVDLALALKYFQLSAAQGCPEAQNNLGYLYRFGYGVSKDGAQAINYLTLANNQGLAKAAYNLGRGYTMGNFGTADVHKGLSFLLTASNKGLLSTFSSLGDYYSGELSSKVKKDAKQAIYYYEKGAEAGDLGSMQALADMFLYKKSKKDQETGFRYQNLAASQGDSYGEFGVACCYQVGLGVERNLDKAFYFLQQAASSPSATPFALSFFGLYHIYGIATNKDESQGFDLCSKGAQKDPRLNGFLGWCYLNGIGCNKDLAKAIQCFEAGVSAGCGPSPYFLGLCYEKGIGVTQDTVNANLFYQMASRVLPGDAVKLFFDMNLLGECYEFGRGFSKDLPKALELYKQAAGAGSLDAIKNLGRWHQNGIEVTQSSSEALMYYTIAANHGDVEAQTMLASLTQQQKAA